MLVLAYAIPAGLAFCHHWAALPLATAPLAIGRVRALLRATTGPEFNDCLAGTAKLMMLHGVLFAAGLWLS